jgi:FkbM family methyltransferase
MPERGIDPFDDIRAHLDGLTIGTVFDVGANVGQSATRFLLEFPQSSVYCFEPAADTFTALRNNMARLGAKTFRLALGATVGRGQLAHDTHPLMYRLLRDDNDHTSGLETEEVEVETVDHFCLTTAIDRVSLLKIDTEGNDLEVLRGSTHMLQTKRVDLVQVEASMNSRNTRHVALEPFRQLLEPMGYFLFAIYDQVHEWPTKEPHLRRCNPLFVSDRVIAACRHQ